MQRAWHAGWCECNGKAHISAPKPVKQDLAKTETESISKLFFFCKYGKNSSMIRSLYRCSAGSPELRGRVREKAPCHVGVRPPQQLVLPVSWQSQAFQHCQATQYESVIGWDPAAHVQLNYCVNVTVVYYYYYYRITVIIIIIIIVSDISVIIIIIVMIMVIAIVVMMIYLALSIKHNY